jgi:hypothetical protein
MTSWAELIGKYSKSRTRGAGEGADATSTPTMGARRPPQSRLWVG